VLCRFLLLGWGDTYIERVILRNPKETITKFGMRKTETLRYFSLVNSIAPSSAVLVIRFHIAHFWVLPIVGPNSRADLRDVRPIFTKFQDIHSSTQYNFMLRFQLRRFKMVAVQSGLESIKTAQNGSKFCGFKALVKFRRQIYQVSKRKTKIAAKPDRVAKNDENPSSECGDLGLYNKINNITPATQTAFRFAASAAARG